MSRTEDRGTLARKIQGGRAHGASKRKATGSLQGLSNGASGIESWRLVDREQLALLVGRHADEISRGARKGMPVLQPGGPGVAGVYDAVACLEWFRSRRGGTVEAERARRDAAQAALAEQLLATRSRELLPKAEVARVWSGACTAIKAAIMAIPTTEAEKLAAIAVEHGAVGVEAQLAAIAHRVLLELATDTKDRPS
jgi:phage terminase Nu1 subunit (DNA packaging protein)